MALLPMRFPSALAPTRPRDGWLESARRDWLDLREWARRPRRGWQSRSLAEDFSGNPQVVFRYFENSTANGLQPGGLELTRKGKPTSLEESTLKEVMPSTPTVMPPKLPQEQLARLSREELTD